MPNRTADRIAHTPGLTTAKSAHQNTTTGRHSVDLEQCNGVETVHYKTNSIQADCQVYRTQHIKPCSTGL